jgi:hypothetical protein
VASHTDRQSLSVVRHELQDHRTGFGQRADRLSVAIVRARETNISEWERMELLADT